MRVLRVRKGARTHSDGLLTWMQILSVGTPRRAREENVAHSECGLPACYPPNRQRNEHHER